MFLTFWFLLLLVTQKIHAEHCLFLADELQSIKEHKVVGIDSKEIISFIKNNPNELEVLKYIENNRKTIQIDDNYKFALERIINHNGFDHMISDKRMSRSVFESNEAHHVISYPQTTKQRLIKKAGRIMLVHGIYTSIVTCSHQILSPNCALNVGGLTTSIIIARYEPVLIAKFAPKIVKMSSRMGSIIGHLLFPQARFAIRLIATKAAINLLQTGGAVLGGVFDIVDICINAKFLIDCKTNGGCSDREIRDSIVSLSISGISFVAGIAFAALGMPGVGLIFSLVLLIGQIFYGAFSAVAEYSERYHITFDEGADVFFRSLVFMQPSERVQMLARRTEYVNYSSKLMWETLNNYTDTVKGFGMGLGDISLDNNDIRPSRAFIDLTEKGDRQVSRVIPESLNSNAEMICLPIFRNEPYENGRWNHVGSAVYYCDNAMVFIDKRRQNAKTIVMNLQYVSGGQIKGSNEWNNVFLVYDTNRLHLVGGASVINQFILFERKSSPDPIIMGGRNAINVIDMSNLRADEHDILHISYGNNRITMQQMLSSGGPWFTWLSDTFDSTVDTRSYRLTGRRNTTNNVYCLMDMTESDDFLLINTMGGTKDLYDVVVNCPKVILSPFTIFYSQIDREKVIFDVQTNGYIGTDLRSIIYFEKGQINIIFNEFDLIGFDTIMTYSYSEKILFIILKWSGNEFKIHINGYTSESTKISLFNKKKHMIVPKVPNDIDIDTPITSFEVFAMCSQESYQNVMSNVNNDACITDAVHFDTKLKLLTTIQFKDNHNNDSSIVGSSYSDIIHFNVNIKFGNGRNGRDLYYVKERHNTAIIFNYAEDKILDYVFMPTKMPRTFSIQFNNILVDNVEVRDFLNSSYNQHIVFIDNDMKIFFPLQLTLEMTPFIQATPQQNAFFLDSSYNFSHIVLHDGNGDADYEMYRDNDDLIILQQRKDDDSFIISIENFYMNIDKWSNITWVMYYDNGTLIYRYDFIYGINEIMEYKEKLKQDYFDIFTEYIFNSSIAVSVSMGNTDHINILNIDETIYPKNITIFKNGEHLIFIDQTSNNTFEIQNWTLSPSHRISIIELPVTIEHFEPITIRAFNRFTLVQIDKMENLLRLARENYDILPKITPLTLIGIKCIISNDSLSDSITNSYKCLGFNSLDEQVHFTNKYCDLNTIKWFKNETTMDQARATITFLQNNLVLQHVFGSDNDNNCEPFFLKTYASQFIANPIDLNNQLLKAINDTNRFKDLIEMGANPKTLSNDTFQRTVLHMAVLVENFNNIKFIVSRRLVDINSVDSEDKTALYYAFKRLANHCDKDVVDSNCFRRDSVINLMAIADYLLSESGTVKKPHEISNIAMLISIYAPDYENIQNFANNLI